MSLCLVSHASVISSFYPEILTVKHQQATFTLLDCLFSVDLNLVELEESLLY